MKNVIGSITNEELTVRLSGHIDSTNAAKVESEINTLLYSGHVTRVTIDCGALEYVSSAGLRILLRLKKAVDDMHVINVSSTVYETLQITGFTDIMDVKKAYRTLCVEGCEVLGQGANGKVYRIDPDTIVKTYLNDNALIDIDRERELARTAFVLGIPTAIPYDVVRIEGGGYGAVYELLNASSYAQLLISGKKTIDELAEMSISILKLMHSTNVKPGTFPERKARVLKWVEYLEQYLDPEIYAKLHRLVSDIPSENTVLHGDFHIKNIMFMNGESLLVDMDTLCCGHPVFEFASMYDAYRGFSEPDRTAIERFLGITYDSAEELWQKSLRLYLGSDDEAYLRSVEEKVCVLSSVHLMRHFIKRGAVRDGKAINEAVLYKRHIDELVPKLDRLTF